MLQQTVPDKNVILADREKGVTVSSNSSNLSCRAQLNGLNYSIAYQISKLSEKFNTKINSFTLYYYGNSLSSQSKRKLQAHTQFKFKKFLAIWGVVKTQEDDNVIIYSSWPKISNPNKYVNQVKHSLHPRGSPSLKAFIKWKPLIHYCLTKIFCDLNRNACVRKENILYALVMVWVYCKYTVSNCLCLPRDVTVYLLYTSCNCWYCILIGVNICIMHVCLVMVKARRKRGRFLYHDQPTYKPLHKIFFSCGIDF